MPEYTYRATTMQGGVVEGVLEAPDESSVVEKLRATGVIPLRITQKSAVSRSFSFRRRSNDTLLTMTAELAVLLNAGLPLDRSLQILSNALENEEMRQILQSVLKAIREGCSLSEAMKRQPEMFPPLYINMVRAGEAGGVLDRILERLVEYMETIKELRDHVFSAMIYPVILAVTGGCSILVLLLYVLPKFHALVADMGSSLPLASRLLFGFSGLVSHYWWAGWFWRLLLVHRSFA